MTESSPNDCFITFNDNHHFDNDRVILLDSNFLGTSGTRYRLQRLRMAIIISRAELLMLPLMFKDFSGHRKTSGQVMSGFERTFFLRQRHETATLKHLFCERFCINTGVLAKCIIVGSKMNRYKEIIIVFLVSFVKGIYFIYSKVQSSKLIFGPMQNHTIQYFLNIIIA